MEGYQPIENYGVIGDLNTVALVGLNGSIDFMCCPDFDSPSVFCAMLDVNKGGNFEIVPVREGVKHKQMYIPDTNVLLTRFLSPEGVGEVTDFMPVEESYQGHALIRRVTSVRGHIRYQMWCRPRFNYAKSSHKAHKKGEYEIVFHSEGEDNTIMRLKSTVPLELKDGDAFADFTLNPGETADFLLEEVKEGIPERKHLREFIDESLIETVNWWKRWISRSKYKGRWQETVNRSALILKLLTSSTHGSIVAAPTFSLPEQVGGSKNWDYRYIWIRDAAFTLYALIRLGYTKEAGAFMHWLGDNCTGISEPGGLNLMYSLAGEKKLTEVELDHLEGYRKSAPVRIGNGAYDQLQLDIYGELMDSIYLYNKYGEMISDEFWENITLQMNWLCDNYRQPDEGIWEVRGGRREFLYSRLLCWVAFDRAVRLSQKRSLPMNMRWVKVRDDIYQQIFTEFWSEKRQAFVQSKGVDQVDASTLLMPLVRFISPRDPKWLSTLKAIEEDLVSDSLVYRYKEERDQHDQYHAGEGTFSLCTFWYVECLSRAGYLEKAQLYFEKMLGYSNHLGLYAEQLGYQGEHLGNFPQAFTHLGLISAAYNLDAQLNDARNRQH